MGRRALIWKPITLHHRRNSADLLRQAERLLEGKRVPEADPEDGAGATELPEGFSDFVSNTLRAVA